MPKLVHALIVLALLAAGCNRVDASVITAAPEKVEQAGSARLEMTGTMTVGISGQPGVETRVHGEGVMNFNSRTGRQTLTLSSPQFDELGLQLRPCEMVHDGTTVYLGIPEDARPDFDGAAWFQGDLGGQPGIDPSTFGTNPSATLDYLRAVSSDLEEIGTEDIRGTSTTHYRFLVSVEAIVENAEEVRREELAASFERLGVEALDVDVWLDEQGLPRRTAYVFEANQTIDLRMETSLELYDFGAEVMVDPPLSSEVIDAPDLQTAVSVCQGIARGEQK